MKSAAELDEIVDAIFGRVVPDMDNVSPAEWETDDRITFGQWRAAIKAVLAHAYPAAIPVTDQQKIDMVEQLLERALDSLEERAYASVITPEQLAAWKDTPETPLNERWYGAEGPAKG